MKNNCAQMFNPWPKKEWKHTVGNKKNWKRNELYETWKGARAQMKHNIAQSV